MRTTIIIILIGGLWLLSISVANENEEIIMPDIDRAIVIAPTNESKVPPNTVLLDVPFTSQAPFANWSMPYQEACEEAALIMARAYLENHNLNPESMDKQILAMVEWEKLNKYPIDLDIKEVAEIAKSLYNFKSEIYYDRDVSIENIKKILALGHPIIIPAAGQLLGNPNFTGAGPAYHMLVIVGYDENNFITNDPGTRHGKNYRYSYGTLLNAIHDWNGSKNTIKKGRKAMLILTST